MMLSSTLPHCSWELASYYRSTTRHMKYPLCVRYVWGCFQFYVAFTAFRQSFCFHSLMNLRDIWCSDTRLMLHDVTTKLFTGSSARPAGQFNTQAQLGIYRSYFCTSLLYVCVGVCVCLSLYLPVLANMSVWRAVPMSVFLDGSFTTSCWYLIEIRFIVRFCGTYLIEISFLT